MRRFLLAILALTTACGPRRVEVRTAPTSSNQSLEVSNDLTQAVNVYVTVAGSDTFLRQVPAKTAQVVPLPGLNAGTTVSFKAVTVDGTRTFTRENVSLSGTYPFPLP